MTTDSKFDVSAAFVSEADVIETDKASAAFKAIFNLRDDEGQIEEEHHRVYCNLTNDKIDAAFNGNQEGVKTLVRDHHLPMVNTERRHLWKTILDKRMTEGRGFPDASLVGQNMYEDTIQSCFGTKDVADLQPGLPGFVDHSHTSGYFLTPRGRHSVSVILNALEYNCPQVQYCPQLYSLCSVARHYLSELDTYKLMSCLVTSKQTTYLVQSRLQAEVTWRVTLELCQKLCKKYMGYLQAESSKEEVEGLFQDCIWWVIEWLPFPHIVRIFDCFLVEGEKIFYRVCCALISLFTRRLKGKAEQRAYSSATGENSDSVVADDPMRWSGAIQKRGLHGAFIHFCRDIPVSAAWLVDKGFRYKNFSKATIQQLKMRIEVEVKSMNLMTDNSLSNNRTLSADNVQGAAATGNVKAVSANLAYKQGMSTPQPINRSTNFKIHHLKSEFLTASNLNAIWRWIPQRVTMGGSPQLAYASYNDGLSLTTFYARSEAFEPTVLVVKTTCQEVFGAYCSTSWSQRGLKDEKGQRQIYFGGGETFLFSFSQSCLDSPEEEVKIYPWVLGPSAVSKLDQSQLSKAELHSHQLFMAGQHDMISIGGGGGNGIYIDGTLSRGKTESCKTFGNSPLCKSSDFEISAIEVFGLGLAD